MSLQKCHKRFYDFQINFIFYSLALSLAVISNINTILHSDKEYFYYSLEKLNIIKHEHIIQVILILSANLLLNILDFFIIVCEIFDSCCQKKTASQAIGYSYPTYHREVNTNTKNNNNNNGAIIYGEVRVETTTTICRKNEINNH